jgi:hypothetical protein
MSEKPKARDISINLTEYVVPELVPMQCFGPFEQGTAYFCHYEKVDARRACRDFQYSVTVTLSFC